MLQGWVKEWSLGCVNSPSAARTSQEAGFTQLKAHLLADPCTYMPMRMTLQSNGKKIRFDCTKIDFLATTRKLTAVASVEMTEGIR